jgi:hypothetical protein
MNTLPLDPYLRDLGFLVAEHGLGEFESDIARLIVRLRAARHCGTLIDLLADHTAPSQARERALGSLIGVLQRDIELVAAGEHQPLCLAA